MKSQLGPLSMAGRVFDTQQGDLSMSLPPNATTNEVLAEIGYLQDRIHALIKQRNALPRNDKQEAHRLLGEINSLTAEVKRIKPALTRAKAHETAREQHGLWASAVAALYGPDAPRQCFDWMKAERIRRKEGA